MTKKVFKLKKKDFLLEDDNDQQSPDIEMADQDEQDSVFNDKELSLMGYEQAYKRYNYSRAGVENLVNVFGEIIPEFAELDNQDKTSGIEPGEYDSMPTLSQSQKQKEVGKDVVKAKASGDAEEFYGYGLVQYKILAGIVDKNIKNLYTDYVELNKAKENIKKRGIEIPSEYSELNKPISYNPYESVKSYLEDKYRSLGASGDRNPEDSAAENEERAIQASQEEEDEKSSSFSTPSTDILEEISSLIDKNSFDELNQSMGDKFLELKDEDSDKLSSGVKTLYGSSMNSLFLEVFKDKEISKKLFSISEYVKISKIYFVKAKFKSEKLEGDDKDKYIYISIFNESASNYNVIQLLKKSVNYKLPDGVVVDFSNNFEILIKERYSINCISPDGGLEETMFMTRDYKYSLIDEKVETDKGAEDNQGAETNNEGNQ